MGEFNYNEYMLNIASTAKFLQHTIDKPCFSRVSSLDKLEEYLSQIRVNVGFQLIIIDNPAGRYNDDSASDNLVDRQVYTFFIFTSIGLNDFDLREKTIAETKLHLQTILSKFFQDRANYLKGMETLIRSSISYTAIGPIANNCHGLMVHFTLNHFPEILYNENDWL